MTKVRRSRFCGKVGFDEVRFEADELLELSRGLKTLKNERIRDSLFLVKKKGRKNKLEKF